jgi:hypothetical protein
VKTHHHVVLSPHFLSLTMALSFLLCLITLRAIVVITAKCTVVFVFAIVFMIAKLLSLLLPLSSTLLPDVSLALFLFPFMKKMVVYCNYRSLKPHLYLPSSIFITVKKGIYILYSRKIALSCSSHISGMYPPAFKVRFGNIG